jgi:glucosylceramidase
MSARTGIAVLLGCMTLTAPARTWTLVETARDNGNLLATVPTQVRQAAVSKEAAITIDPARRYQEIVGFGGSLTESSAWVLAQLPAGKRMEIIRRYFDARDGIGYTMARTHINSSDFSLHLWSLAETPGDYELHDFTLAPMRKWMMPLIHDARRTAGGDRFRLVASPWSPPAWMKTNNRMDDGGKLRPEYRPSWASFFVKFVEHLQREEGIPVWGLTVQNEPEAKQTWESCLYTPAEERDFIRDHLGPALHRAGLQHVRLMAHDHNRDILEAHADAVFGDPECAKYLWGTALHWYVSDDYAAASRVHAKYPDKHILFTEGCLESGAKIGQWDRGERYARSIINDLRNWVCGWIDWNIVLDTRGGPNHVGNFCDAPVLVDTKTGAVHYQNSFHYIGHFSRFVHPGARRIESGGNPPGLLSIAFANPDGSLVVVVMNATDTPVDFSIAVSADTLSCRIPAHAIQTYCTSRE